MSNLNASTKTPVGVRNPKTGTGRGKSYQGNVQRFKSYEQELYEILVMSLFGKGTYYEPEEVLIARLDEAIAKNVKNKNLDFIANCILRARSIMHIRSYPIIATVLFAGKIQRSKQKFNIRRLVCDVIQRADQITDMYAVALQYFGKKNKVPLAIRRGVADAFNKFDEYQFAKYNQKKVVTFSDALRIVHPKPINAQQGEIFAKIISDSLNVPYTWETELSKNGQLPPEEQKSKKELWTELLESGKLGHMALLRNLRNICAAGVSAKTIQQYVAPRLRSKSEVRKSKQLPFRYLTALVTLQEAATRSAYSDKPFKIPTSLITALNKALEHSLINVPVLGERVWIILDASGSMTSNWGGSPNGGPSPYQIGALFAAALVNAHEETEVEVTIFSDDAKMITDKCVGNNISTILNNMGKEIYGGGTNLNAALAYKPKLGFEPDTVIIISDMQVTSLNGHSRSALLFESDTVKLALNLAPYNTTPISEQQGWIQLAGWNDRVFDFVQNIRKDNVQSLLAHLKQPYPSIE